jgi:integrase
LEFNLEKSFCFVDFLEKLRINPMKSRSHNFQFSLTKFIALTGARASEAVRIKKSDCKWTEGESHVEIKIREKKDPSKYRKVMAPFTLFAYLRGNHPVYLISRRKRKSKYGYTPISSRRTLEIVKAVTTELGYPITVEGLRMAAVRAVLEGCSMEESEIKDYYDLAPEKYEKILMQMVMEMDQDQK